jgi:hypothetical protein
MSLITAGFLLIKPYSRPDWGSERLLPQEIISASDCLCPQFPDSYAIKWTSDSEENKAKGFDSVGLSPNLRAAATEWATENFQKSFGWTGVFYSLQDAQSAKALFFPEDSNMWLIGLGLPTEFAVDFLEYAAPPSPKEGYAPMGASGWFEVVKKLQPLPKGQFLGFELLNVEHGNVSHSWLCNHLEVHFSETLGIQPNQLGLIEELDDAKQCCEDINDEKVGAEPGLWLPWGLIKYNEE